MIKVSRKSEYTGMFGVQHICDRCGKIIYLADTSKKPVGNEIDICKTCAVELWNKEKEELRKAEGKHPKFCDELIPPGFDFSE